MQIVASLNERSGIGLPHSRPIIGMLEGKDLVTPCGNRWRDYGETVRPANGWERVVWAYLVGRSAGVNFSDISTHDPGDEDR